MCSCVNGYTGDPFTQCVFRERKYLSKAGITSVIICMFDVVIVEKKMHRVLLSRINDHFTSATLKQKSRKLY